MTKKKKEEYKYTPPPPIKKSIAKPDPDGQVKKVISRYNPEPRHNFWNLFKEEE